MAMIQQLTINRYLTMQDTDFPRHPDIVMVEFSQYTLYLTRYGPTLYYLGVQPTEVHYWVRGLPDPLITKEHLFADILMELLL